MWKFTLELNAAKNIDYIDKWFKQKLHRIKFSTKNSMDACLYLLLEWRLGSSKDLCFWNFIMHWNEKVHFRVERCKNIDYIEKCFKQKLHRIKLSTKNSETHISICLRSGARGSKDLRFWKIIMHWNEELYFRVKCCRKHRLY